MKGPVRCPLLSNPSLPLFRLLKPHSDLLHRLMEMTTRSLPSDAKRQAWLKDLGEKAIEICQNLGPGRPGSEDDDDTQALLSHSLVVRLFPSYALKGSSVDTATFRVRLATSTLRHIGGDMEWDEQGKLISEMLPEIPMVDANESRWVGWRALASACVVLEGLQPGETGGPRCLACAETAMACVLGGIGLLPLERDEKGNPIPDAKALLKVLNRVEEACDRLEAACRKCPNVAHFRRAEFFLSCLRVHLRHYQTEVRRMAGLTPTKSVQKSMTNWVNSTDNNGDDDDTVADDDDDDV
mmetsp:Transcript_23643/g.55049  ORF Transcript_23643/g.55049 Transcript_23643/m.55049 type:complete len:297 (-) Transcript_23643:724-1614(-)